MRRTRGSPGLGTKERKKEGERELRDIEAIRETTAPGNWTLVTRTRLRGKSDSAPSLSEYNCIYLDSPDWIIIVNERPRERDALLGYSLDRARAQTFSLPNESLLNFPAIQSLLLSLLVSLSFKERETHSSLRCIFAPKFRFSTALDYRNIIRLTEDRIFKENFWQETSYISYSTAVFRLAFCSMGSRSTFHFQRSVLSMLSRRKKNYLCLGSRKFPPSRLWSSYFRRRTIIPP